MEKSAKYIDLSKVKVNLFESRLEEIRDKNLVAITHVNGGVVTSDTQIQNGELVTTPEISLILVNREELGKYDVVQSDNIDFVYTMNHCSNIRSALDIVIGTNVINLNKVDNVVKHFENVVARLMRREHGLNSRTEIVARLIKEKLLGGGAKAILSNTDGIILSREYQSKLMALFTKIHNNPFKAEILLTNF
jgi:hypothetical protein